MLGIGIGAGGPGLDQQQGARTVGRGPGAIDHRGLPFALELAEQLHHFAGRIAWQQGFDHQAGRRGEQVDALAQSRMQSIHAEALGCHGRTQQIAVVEKISLVTRGTHGLAVVDTHKRRIEAQVLRQLFGQMGAGGRVGALHAHQDQARGQAITDLVQQQLLLRRRAARQESRQVIGELAAADDDATGQDKGQPGEDGETAMTLQCRPHLAATFSIDMTELSPSTCVTSMLRISSRTPVMRISATTCFILLSSGTSFSVQVCAEPSRLSW